MIKEIIPSINLILCNRCGQCVMQCPEDALEMTDKGPIFVEPILCTYCGVCENLCPTGAIRAPLFVTWHTQPKQNY